MRGPADNPSQVMNIHNPLFVVLSIKFATHPSIRFVQVSAGGACAGGWTTGEFPDAFPFYCGESVTNGQRANMYGCNSGPLAESGYTLGANDNVCGCPDWQLVDVDAPPISQCQGINPEWVELAQPWAHYLKRACPTAYTFPYDDQTSTFDCVDGDESDPDFVNTQSCEYLGSGHRL